MREGAEMAGAFCSVETFGSSHLVGVGDPQPDGLVLCQRSTSSAHLLHPCADKVICHVMEMVVFAGDL